jgi:ubiquinone/menaquinone biosynthesis C-methylase UbiE
MPTPNRFDGQAATWDNEPRRVALARDVAAAMLRMGNLTPDMDVLDYGCGTGLVTLALSPHVRLITAADSSTGMLETLSSKIEAAGITNVRPTYMDLTTQEPPWTTYDAIVSSMTLHHLPDVAKVLRAFRGMLCGRKVICLADLDTEGGRFHPDPTGVYHQGFDRAELQKLVEKECYLDVRFETAHIMTRPAADGSMQDFSIFVMAARRFSCEDDPSYQEYLRSK